MILSQILYRGILFKNDQTNRGSNRIGVTQIQKLHVVESLL